MPFSVTHGGPRDYHTEWSKSEKNKYMISFICELENKKGIDELIYKTEIELQM